MNTRNLIKRTISLLCAIVLSVSMVLAGLPGRAAASVDTAPPTDFKELKWTDFTGLAYREYEAPAPDAPSDPAKGIYDGDLNRTLLNGNVIMGAGTDIRFAGTTVHNGWYGIIIWAQMDGTLRILNSTYTTYYDETYQPADYDLTSFVDTQFNLKISTEIDGDDYTFGIWVNDKMLGDYFTLTDSDGGAGTTLGLYKRDGENSIELLPLSTDVPTDFTTISWTDFAGLQCQEYEAPNPDATGAKGTYSGSLNKTLLDGNIIMGAETDIRYAGMPSNPGWSGLLIRANTAGQLLINSSTFDTAYDVAYQPEDYGLTSFVDTEFNLKISIEIKGNDYTFGIWVNNQILGDYFTLTESEGAGANALGLYDNGAGGSITLVGEQTEEPEKTAPPTDFTEIGWSDFEGLEYKEYVAPKAECGTYAKSLDKTLFSGDIIMGADTDIRYAGMPSNPGWSGLLIYVTAEGKLIINSSTFDTTYDVLYEPADYGLTSFADVKFNLKISTEIDGDDYTFGIWINDQMLGDYFTLTESEGGGANTLGLYDRESGKSITLVEGQTAGNVPTDFTEIGWSDFTGLECKEYVAPKGYSGTYAGSLDKTLFSGDIIMGADTDIRYAGMPSNPGWSGLIIYATAEGKLIINSSTFDTTYDVLYEPADYGLTSFAGVEFNLKVSTEIDGDDYTFGIWVNNQMLGDYFTLTESEGGGANTLGLYDRESGKSITLIGEQTGEPDTPVDPDDPDDPVDPNLPTDFKEITWSNFKGLSYQEYVTPNPDLNGAKGTYTGSLNKTLFSGDIIMGPATDVRYAGMPSNPGWSGLVIRAREDGMLVIDSSTFDTAYSAAYNPADYGLTSFVDVEFNLKISTEINGNDYTFGIWINDQMLGNYFTLTESEGGGANSLGLYENGLGGNITLVGEPGDDSGDGNTEPIPFPSDFKVVTLEDFSGGIRSGSLGSGNAVAGQLKEADDFDKIVFDADIDVSTLTPGDATYLRFAGESGGWVGIGFETRSNGTMVLKDWTSDIVLQTYNKETAGVDFYAEGFNLKISFEYVDADGDGKKDDVQMGVYFNNVLYDNQLAVATDYEMTNFLLAYTDDAVLHPLTLKSTREPVVTDPIKPDKNLKKISFSSFGIEDAVFDEIDTLNFCTSGSYQVLGETATLDGTLFHGKVKYGTTGSSELRFGGSTTPWLGLRIVGFADGTISLAEAEQNAPEKQFSYSFNPQDAGCTLVGEWLDLKISTQFVDNDKDGKKDDVKLGIWFNDVMYLNEYIYLNDYAPHMGTYLSVYSSSEDGYIAIKSVEVDNTLSLAMFGFEGDYRKHFQSIVKETVKGEPLGVTTEYDTVDYKLDVTRKASEVEKVTGEGTADNSVNLNWGIVALAGVVVVAGIVICILLIAKKKKEQ